MFSEKAAYHPKLVFMWVLYPGQIGKFGDVSFCEGRKPENPEKDP